ncbi:MAG: hypothetical protein H6Q14_1236 [Bacteroidetes bacterium]|nr:hypothetical protein [Bacteroidota bacterium]
MAGKEVLFVSIFQFYKVRLKEEYNSSSSHLFNAFQFYKVRLKAHYRKGLFYAFSFQFYKVRLKVIPTGCRFPVLLDFNSTKCD